MISLMNLYIPPGKHNDMFDSIKLALQLVKKLYYDLGLIFCWEWLELLLNFWEKIEQN